MANSRTLYVPLHLPIKSTLAMIQRELKYREIVDFKVEDDWLELTHEPMCHESKAELLDQIDRGYYEEA